MDWNATLAAVIAGAAATALCGWRGARPPDVAKGPRMAPWRMLMLLGAAFTIVMLVHLVNLAGVSTGNGRP